MSLRAPTSDLMLPILSRACSRRFSLFSIRAKACRMASIFLSSRVCARTEGAFHAGSARGSACAPPAEGARRRVEKAEATACGARGAEGTRRQNKGSLTSSRSLAPGPTLKSRLIQTSINSKSSWGKTLGEGSSKCLKLILSLSGEDNSKNQLSSGEIKKAQKTRGLDVKRYQPTTKTLTRGTVRRTEGNNKASWVAFMIPGLTRHQILVFLCLKADSTLSIMEPNTSK